MSDPNPAVADPGPTAEPTPAPDLLPLAEAYPACFDLERPRPLQVGIHKDLLAAGFADGAVSAATLKLARAAEDYPQWVAALSGSPERFAEEEIALKHPTVQVFEKKARPEAEPARSVEDAPPEPPEANAAEAEAPAAPASNPGIARAAASPQGRRKP